MKKILLSMVALFATVTMNAQIYVGGSFGLWAESTQKNAGDRSETTFSILPEIGYNLNSEWAIGAVIGYTSNKFAGVTAYAEGYGAITSESAFTFNPYVRHIFADFGKVYLFVDGGVDFTTFSKSDATELAVGFKPGLSVALTDNLSFVSHLGFIGWQQLNPDGDDNNYSSFGLGMKSTNLTFGLYYNF